MRKVIDNSEIEKIVLNAHKLTSYQSEPYPLNSLQDREFEVLLFFLYKELSNDSESFFDSVTLMSGIAEQGRDVVLSFKGKDVGVVQCKKYNKNIDKPSIAREIIKFALYQIIEGNLIPTSTSKFHYAFAVSTGLSNTAKKIIRNHPTEIIDSEDFEKWTQDVIDSHSSFKYLIYHDIKNDLQKVLKRIALSEITPQEIKKHLDQYSSIADYFFKRQKVTDNTLLEKIINKYLEPILSSISQIEPTSLPIDFKIQFKKYLKDSLEHYSYAKTLVFGNQQKKLGDLYIPLTLKCSKDSQNILIDKYPKNLIPKFKKVLISDTGGMGKSTVMKWLFLNAIKQREGIPVFIELRALKNNHTIIDEILKQLQPLDKTYDKLLIQKIIAEGNFIFFFDGFDEIGIEHREKVIIDLQDFIRKAGESNSFIITSRPESALLSFADFQEFKIRPLLKVEAFSLIRKLGNNNEKSERLIQKIEEQKLENINEFLENPLLVSLLFKKFEYRESIPFDKKGFYYGVFDALFEGHDITKDGAFIRKKKSLINQTQFHQLLRALGFITLKTFEIEYSKADLITHIHVALKQCPDIQAEVLLFLDDLTSAVPLFLKDGDFYRWQHKSIQEYFASEFICTDSKNEQVSILKSMIKGNNYDKLRNVLKMCYEIDYKTFRNNILYPFCKEFLNYCNNSFQKILENPNIDAKDVRRRQGFQFLINNTKWFVINYDFYRKQNKNVIWDDLKENMFTDYVSNSIFVSSDCISLDGYIVAFSFLSKKISSSQNRFAFMLLDVNSKLVYRKQGSHIYWGLPKGSDLDIKIKSRLKHYDSINEEINLFKENHFIKMERFDENENSLINNEKYFAKVNQLNYAISLNYDECLKLVQKVDEELKESEGNSLSVGF